MESRAWTWTQSLHYAKCIWSGILDAAPHLHHSLHLSVLALQLSRVLNNFTQHPRPPICRVSPMREALPVCRASPMREAHLESSPSEMAVALALSFPPSLPLPVFVASHLNFPIIFLDLSFHFPSFFLLWGNSATYAAMRTFTFLSVASYFVKWKSSEYTFHRNVMRVK